MNPPVEGVSALIGMTERILPVSGAAAVPATRRHVLVSVLWLATLVSVILSVTDNGFVGILGFRVVYLFGSIQSRLGSSGIPEHTHVETSDFMAQTEDEMGEEAICVRLQPFRPHLITTAWQKLVLEVPRGSRTPILALVGGALEGKSFKCISIFGRPKTVVVHCAGYPTGVLPRVDLTERHAAVLWEDIRVDQLLHNREVFASGRPSPPVSEVCMNHGNHQYDQQPLAMMLCANFLPMTVSEGLSAEETFWMHLNVWKVTFEAGTRWCLER